jgi:hypothetical protein
MRLSSRRSKVTRLTGTRGTAAGAPPPCDSLGSVSPRFIRRLPLTDQCRNDCAGCKHRQVGMNRAAQCRMTATWDLRILTDSSMESWCCPTPIQQRQAEIRRRLSPQDSVFPLSAGFSSHQPPEFEVNRAHSVSRDASERVDRSGAQPRPFLVGMRGERYKSSRAWSNDFRSLDRRQRGPEDRLRLFARAALH